MTVRRGFIKISHQPVSNWACQLPHVFERPRPYKPCHSVNQPLGRWRPETHSLKPPSAASPYKSCRQPSLHTSMPHDCHVRHPHIRWLARSIDPADTMHKGAAVNSLAECTTKKTHTCHFKWTTVPQPVCLLVSNPQSSPDQPIKPPPCFCCAAASNTLTRGGRPILTAGQQTAHTWTELGMPDATCTNPRGCCCVGDIKAWTKPQKPLTPGLLSDYCRPLA